MFEWETEDDQVLFDRERQDLPYVLTFFLVAIMLLTWPVLLRPEQIYLAAPPEYYVFQEQEEWGLQWFIGHAELGREYVDHGLHTLILEQAADSFQQFQWPDLVHSDYTVPPTYVLLGGFLTGLLSFPTLIFHNLFFVGSMFLAGLFTYLLVREVVGDPEVALLAGFLYMSSFYVFYVYTLGHTNQWQIQWIPLVLFGIERVGSNTGYRSVTLLGIALALQALSSEQYTVYLTVLVPLYILIRSLYGTNWHRDLRFWKGASAAFGLSLLLASPYLVPRLLLARTGATEVRSLGDNLYHWNIIAETNIVGVIFAADARLQFLFRLTLLVLGAVAILTVARRRQLRLLPFAFLFVVGISLALGPREPWAPYTILYKYWPLVEYFRAPYRTLPFALLGSSTLSAAVLLRISEPGDRWTLRGGAVITIVVAVQLFLVHRILEFSGYTV